MALHVLEELPQVVDQGAQAVESVIGAAPAKLTAARVRRETDEVDLWKDD